MQAKNAALKDAGAVVPDSFEAFEGAIKETYDRLIADGKLVPQPDTPPPSVPLDLEAAKKAGKVGSFIRTLAPWVLHGQLLTTHWPGTW